MQLLGLIRFRAADRDQLAAWDACERFEARLAACEATLIHREDLQMMVLFGDAACALQCLAESLEDGQRMGYAISAGLAQGIRSRATLASSLSGFTEGSIETLFEIADCAQAQEVAISPRLSSIIGLAAPVHAARFVPIARHLPNSRIREPLVMRPLSSAARAG